VQNKHKTYPPREMSREDSGRIEKAPEATGALAAAKLPPLPLSSHLGPWLSRFDPTAHAHPTGL